MEPSSQSPVCRICRKPIEPGAVKCTACGSYQNWRRFFSFGTIALSLLVALISVSTTAIQVTKNMFAKEQSDLRFSLVKYGPDTITIMSSNLGDRAGALRSATLKITMSNEAKTYNLIWEDANLVVKPDGWRLFEMKPVIDKDIVGLQLLRYTGDNCFHSIKFNVLAFDHAPKSSTIRYKCPSS